MAAFDYNALRTQTLHSSHEEEAVTVNTRALIDKVLARYSGEHTTLRELLQNAADANASSVEIRFQSQPLNTGLTASAGSDVEDPRDLLKLKCRRMLVKNDGHAFREEDWQRLKRIAEGNPDETKIGAFGVGFYSVFSDCEEPFVASGDQAMAFYWRGNQLFTRRAKLPNSDRWTTFLLESREPAEIPDLKGLCKFLATSLTFVKLISISLYIDENCLLELTKKASPPMPLKIPSSIDPFTSSKIMRIAEVQTERVQIDARYMKLIQYSPTQQSIVAPVLRSLFRFTSQPVVSVSAEQDLLQYSTRTIFLRIANAKVNTFIDRKSAVELERATKKVPPKITQLAILTMSKPEYDASETDATIFEGVVPSNGGKVFIGFPTHQTTGIKAHISAHSVIPTVERESIDLNARIVRDWNCELLKIAGILSRIMYYDEMGTIGAQTKELSGKDMEALYESAIHVMRQFTFTDSTPSENVGRHILSGFWQASKETFIELLSTKGVLPSNQIRLTTDISFLESLPMLPKALSDGAPAFVKALVDNKILVEVTMADIVNQLENKALSGVQVIEFLKWAARQRLSGAMDPDALHRLMEVAIISDEGTGGPIILGNIRYTVNKSKLHDDIPLPADTIPFHITKSMAPRDLEALGWSELGVAEWLDFLCSRKPLSVKVDFTINPEFAQLVLSIISKNWDKEPQGRKDYLVMSLKQKTCIPTKQGMKKPGEAYFPTVKLFEDLPIIALNGVKEKVLIALGVRKTVELKIVFDRLMDENAADINGGKGAKWSHVDLIKYLVGVKDDIPLEDITRLRGTPICKSEGLSGGLHKVSALYEPNDQLRKLKLPILQWPGEWRPASNEAKFLMSLGLMKCPDVRTLVGLMAGADRSLAESALAYYIVNFLVNEYNSEKIPTDIPFLPLDPMTTDPKAVDQLVVPNACFTNSKASLLKFLVLRKDLHPHADKFMVKSDPSMDEAVTRLLKCPPQTPKEAIEQFSYFASRLGEIMPHHVQRLTIASIVPVHDREAKTEKGTSKIKHLTPLSVYLGSRNSQYAEVFDFVDFGPHANPFLWKCGSKTEPTHAEVAYLLVREPGRLLDAFQGYQKYLTVLRTVAENFQTLKKDKGLVKLMKRSRFLLGSMDLPVQENSNSVEDEQTIKEYQLAAASEIVISDDFVAYNLFKDTVLVAPQEDILEGFYASLGSSTFSSVITEDYTIGARTEANGQAQKLQKLIVERIQLFLHSQDQIRHDAKWIQKNVKVEMVQRIRLRRSLKISNGQQLAKVQEVTAAITEQDSYKVLFVTPKYHLFDVSQLLVTMVLHKPKLHSSLLLESLLSTALEVLKLRGYNVDRILKARAAEARLAEQARRQREEERAKALQEEAKLVEERTLQAEVEAKKHREIIPTMPGGFGSPVGQRGHDGVKQPQVPAAPISSFFNRFSRQFFDSQKERDKGIFSGVLGGGSSSAGGSTTTLTPQETTVVRSPEEHKHKPTQPHVLRANLQSAINASRAHNSNQVFSPAQMQQVQEQKTYCDSKLAHDIKYLTEMPSGIRLFVERYVETSFLRANIFELNSFSSVLLEVAAVFDLPTPVIHMYYDDNGPTIAFNLNGSLFFNFRYYRELHHAAWVAGGETAVKGRKEALIYWFVTACHELGHNIIKDHSSDHSFYTESFVQMYFAECMSRCEKIAVQTAQGLVGAPPSYDAAIARKN
ncbi:hypothetical protein L211DRAFT_822540 [Terfezia boudieri ATCC MYA-4762]|uniref:Sacsin/Nov domain-containing protein n=1 Tax=Terfezia boudieri ATCC MYA-4762 TaxID=1051890 RepID=A0A3N4LS13_9PEZI|nr:hypothetical protein L211DRAFT_822540 [Terfezia boudieri ATCC MYA-4762]